MNNLFSLLKKCNLFKNKSSNEIQQLLSNISYKIESFEKNQIILSPIQTADKIGIILSGIVDIQKLLPSGKIVTIERKKHPDLIAEACIFSKLEHYSDTLYAGKPCKILFILKTNLLKLFELDKDFMLNFLESVSNSTLALKHKIGILSLDSIQEKIAVFLIHYKKNDYNASDLNTITLPFSKKEWSEYMNVSRTSLSRALRKLEVQGTISFHKRTIKILDLKRLQKILSL